MSDVFDEIQDDLQRQKLHDFWKENGSWIIGGAIAAVLMTGVLAFWRQWEYRRDAAVTTELTRLIDGGDLAKLESFIGNTGKNHAMVARFAAAAAHLEHGEKDKAVAMYGDIANTSGIDKSWRELAQVLSISQRLDKGSPDKLAQELAELSGDRHMWRYTARELEALLAARQGNLQKSAEILTKIIADPSAPPDFRNRAQMLRELYTGDIKPLSSKN